MKEEQSRALGTGAKEQNTDGLSPGQLSWEWKAAGDSALVAAVCVEGQRTESDPRE